MVRCNTVTGHRSPPRKPAESNGFWCWLSTINCEPPGGNVTAFLGCGQTWRDPPPEEQGGSLPRACLRFGVSKLDHAPKTKRLQHGQGDLRVQIETKEINRVIGCFSEGSLKNGGAHIFTSGPRERGAAIFIPPAH